MSYVAIRMGKSAEGGIYLTQLKHHEIGEVGMEWERGEEGEMMSSWR